ncbi:MAG: hypothetical protein II203_03150 [Phascolarctobacterium sp.]|nr:hypothetical protein [Phascolarctobacterium sp.]
MLAQILGFIACVATPRWRMEMAKANIMECLGVDEQRATVIAEDSMRRFGRSQQRHDAGCAQLN